VFAKTKNKPKGLLSKTTLFDNCYVKKLKRGGFIMAKFLGNLFEKDNPAKKLQKEIEGMEFKKQSLVSAIESEVRTVKQKIDKELYQIGLNVYTRYLNGTYSADELKEHFNEIKTHTAVIAEKETKIKEFSNRYDEEISILRSNPAFQNMQTKTVHPPAAGAGVFCESCGKPYNPGEDVFCIGCGQKLT